MSEIECDPGFMPARGKRKYDSTIARMAGNIAPAIVRNSHVNTYGTITDGPTIRDIARFSVELARAIIAEVERTESAGGKHDGGPR